jgi:hypothetical protein
MALRPWLLSARRLTWLRTMMWAVRLRALMVSHQLALHPRLARHVENRLRDFFSPEVITAVRAEWLGPIKIDVLDLFPPAR